MRLPRLLRSVRSRMLLAAILVEATMLTLLVTNSLRLLSDHMIEQARTHAEQIAPVLDAALVAPLAQRDYATVQAILDESRKVQGISYLAILDNSRKVVAVSGWDAKRPLPEPDKEFTLFSANEEPRYDVATPVTLAGQSLGTLRFGLDLSHIVMAHRQLLTQGVLIAVGELFLSAGLLAILGFWLTRHLSALTKASGEVAAGNLTPAAVAEGDDDLGRLGAAFNAMSRAVAERVRDLTDARDIQARLNAQVEQEHARMMSLLAAMDIGVLFADMEGRVLYENPSFRGIWGIPPGPPLQGQRLADIPVMAGVAFRDGDAWRRFLEGGDAVGELELGDGRVVTRRTMAVRQYGGEVAGRVDLYEDVTQDRLAAQQLRAARDAAEAGNRAKAAFLATMSHELRTPMNGVLGMTELLLMTELTDEQREYLGWSKSSAESLLAVLNDVLDFSKIDAGKLDLELTTFDLHDLLNGLVALHRQVAMERPLEVSWEGDVPRKVMGDPVRLRQILNNLLSNAIKFTAAGRVVVRVAVRADAPTPGLCLAFDVEDTGMGIPADKLKHIFSPFAQADSSITRRFGGTGLGLAIASRLAELLGGQLTVDSVEGQGSTFHFSVSMRQADEPAGTIS